jgi:hypothetical protein
MHNSNTRISLAGLALASQPAPHLDQRHPAVRLLQDVQAEPSDAEGRNVRDPVYGRGRYVFSASFYFSIGLIGFSPI